MSDRFLEIPGEWLTAGGPESDAVVSTRIRLARNIKGHQMPWCLSRDQKGELESALQKKIDEAGIIQKPTFRNIADLGDIQRQVLVERHLISSQLAEGAGPRGVAFSRQESLSIMTNEEDHLRIQVIRKGLQIDEAWQTISVVDAALEDELDYAFSSDHGYLTACPTNLGTGLRVSVMLHLPTLRETNQIDKVFRAAARVGLVARGLFGEGSRFDGDLFQVSNQVTLGRSEIEILNDVSRMVLKIIEWERGIRSLLVETDRMKVKDQIRESLGTLRNAHKISSHETMKHLSALRLGINLNLLSDLTLQTVNELFLFTQPAHIQLIRGENLEPDDRDRWRARLIRERLGTEESPDSDD